MGEDMSGGGEQPEAMWGGGTSKRKKLGARTRGVLARKRRGAEGMARGRVVIGGEKNR